MTDITKCPGKHPSTEEPCPYRGDCYRYLAEAWESQSWAHYWRADREKFGLNDCFLAVQEAGE